MRTCAHSYITGDLPEDILRLYAAQEFHFGVRGLHKALLCLHDEDVVFVALEGDIRAEHDIHVKGVDSRRQNLATDLASSEIGPLTVVVGAPSGAVLPIPAPFKHLTLPTTYTV